jgi:hypothetical protein
MMPGYPAVRYGGSDRPSKAEQAATRWHRQQHPTSRADCWCCCRPCRTENPHHAKACAAMIADVEARIRASVREMRLETKRGRDGSGRFARIPPQSVGWTDPVG